MFEFLKKLNLDDDTEELESQSIKVYANRCLRRKKSNVICHNCVQSCPKEAIDLRNSVKLLTHNCDACGMCIEVCPAGVFAFPVGEDEEKKEISRRDFLQRFRFKG